MAARLHQWRAVYDSLSESVAKLGVEDPYGKGDYWVVDDDYGDATQKICVHRKSFLVPELLTAIQASLRSFPGWRVMLQIEFPIKGVPANFSGLVVHAQAIEEHWDRTLHADVAMQLHIETGGRHSIGG